VSKGKTPQKERRTITIDKELEAKLRDLQGQLIMAGNKNWSLSAILNGVVLAGIIGSPKLGKEDWKMIKSFLKKNSINLKRYPIKDYIENLSEL
jgi:hypothetical protein